MLTNAPGIAGIARADAPALTQLRETRADQYGIRCSVQIDAVEIKFAIVLEGRITLEAPPGVPLLREAVAKAEGAYGQSVRSDLAKAIARVKTRQGWLERCMLAMAMDMPKAVLWQRIRALERVLR